MNQRIEQHEENRNERTTTENKGTTEFVKLTSLPFEETYATAVAKSVTVKTGPKIRGTILSMVVVVQGLGFDWVYNEQNLRCL